MKKHEVTYTPEFEASPMSYWVHVPQDGEVWSEAEAYDLPLPRPVPAKGWLRLNVEFDGILLEFSSVAELSHMIDVLEKNPLPSTRALTMGRNHGPNSHWLSRLPGKAKSQKFRQKLVSYLRTLEKEFGHPHNNTLEQPGDV